MGRKILRILHLSKPILSSRPLPRTQSWFWAVFGRHSNSHSLKNINPIVRHFLKVQSLKYKNFKVKGKDNTGNVYLKTVATSSHPFSFIKLSKKLNGVKRYPQKNKLLVKNF